MTKFTEGPWQVKLSSFEGIESASVMYPHGFLTSSNVIPVDETRVDGESWLSMRNRTAEQRKNNELESIANMYLIAAAPEMHDDLQDYIALLRILLPQYPYLKEKLDKALSTDKKARGEL